MNDVVATPDFLSQAVTGLAGIVGFILLPMLGSWLRLALKWVEDDRSGLTGGRQFSMSMFLFALLLSFVWTFFVVCLLRAGAQLREVRLEAPVFAQSVVGLVVGVAIWGIYAVGVGILRADARRAAQRRRAGGNELALR